MKSEANKLMSESMEQILFVNWMRKNHKEHRIFHIPNGGARGAATAARLKQEGVTKGVPDLFIPSLRLWIEMKTLDGGKVSTEQRDWIAYLQECDYMACVCNGNLNAQSVVEIALQLKNCK